MKKKPTIEQEHRSKCVAAIRNIIAKESFETVLSDFQLAYMLKAQGLLASKEAVKGIRRKEGIAGFRGRQILAFARDHKK